MNITETKELITKIFAVDGREVNDQAVNSWHGAIGHLRREVAGTAAKACIQELTVKVMPAHILTKVRDQARERSQREITEDKTGGKFSESAPICDAHGKSMLKCSPCQKELADSHKCRHNLYPIYCVECRDKFQKLSANEWQKHKQII